VFGSVVASLLAIIASFLLTFLITGDKVLGVQLSGMDGTMLGMRAGDFFGGLVTGFLIPMLNTIYKKFAIKITEWCVCACARGCLTPLFDSLVWQGNVEE
jgi:hypothetical protein